MATVSELIVRFLVARRVERLYGLVGGHIQPIWDEAARQGLRIVDARHECAAVHMAHAEALLTGRLGVALLTAGPGLTNAVTGIAHASVSRVPVLVISGRTPRPQSGMGAMQDLPQAQIIQPLCRRVETVSERHHVLSRLDACARAALGADGSPGPAYIEFPTDLMREQVVPAEFDPAWFDDWMPPILRPNADAIESAIQLIRTSHRPLVISGRAVRSCGASVERFLDATKAVYLDTGESRGVIPSSNPAFVPAMRARAMREADLVITLGRRLDFQLAYGSPAVFAPDARFIRIGTATEEISDNRRAAVEIRADVGASLEALCGHDLGAGSTRAWQSALTAANTERARKLATQLEHPRTGTDGRMHPYSLISALNDAVDDHSVLVVDGGDILSFARVALRVTEWYLDPGSLGCIGIGVPFANAAAINHPQRRVLALIGDGSFGFSATEIDTAVRHQARVVYVIGNNEGWNIDRHDQRLNYGQTVGVDLRGCRYHQLASALGAYAERVEDPAQLPAALKRAFANTPALLDVLISGEPTSPDFESGLAEVCTRQALRKWDQAEEIRLKPH